jgi:DNA-binding HxlR family transcriptional regulator
MKEMTDQQAMKHLQDTLFVIGGKWKMPILRALHHGASRYREIQRNVPNITTRVLSKELKHLEENMLVERKVYASPLAVEYKLSQYAYSLIPILEHMVLWGKNHKNVISNKEKL